MTERKQDIYTRLTAKIIAALEEGVRPWVQPWNAEHLAARVMRPLRVNGEPYKGINVVSLWCDAVEKGFANPVWMTYQQATALGAFVRKGERGSPVVFASKIARAEENESGEEVEREIPFLKNYTVFNCEQIEGLPANYYAKAPETDAPKVQPIERVALFTANTRAVIRAGGNRAYYSVSEDHISLPPIECFRDAESYHATALHELTHWTRHEKRLNREFGRKRWGDEGYAAEELVAELGSAFLCADLGITPEVREDHASYIASWLSVLRNDTRAIFTAAAFAQRAVDYLHTLQAPE